jgi:hypothetical protein
MVRLLGASALALAVMTPAAQAAHLRHQAVHAHHRHSHQVRHYRAHHRYALQLDDRYAVGQESAYRSEGFHQARASGARPRAWCGWYARSLVGNDPGATFNLARNWARWGRPASPGPGVMVVWPHHVGMITGRDSNGNWIIKSGNDGHTVRERPRSIAGAIAFRAG